ncbi:hypothetical protein [Mesobacterium pallidum]|uniref:hypothetical protein n=1 Tax=Mesobacterium pallidum TaxID=2872037 RepID=UPI001EE3224C|nr:hypothetical protein [Mesobacterium pallidum]
MAHKGGGRFANIAADWLACALYDDAAAVATFTCPDCGLGTDPVWTVTRKTL